MKGFRSVVMTSFGCLVFAVGGLAPLGYFGYLLGWSEVSYKQGFVLVIGGLIGIGVGCALIDYSEGDR